ncbi:MAG: 50S ribosomal protein L29 [Bacilli bacterium]|jgi:large subunit ribosomal protein L29|nr:50S ribosomal protein L29 [Bacilli bacterium]MCH4228134.1 50S ribosomal protein L29 [Bacilli bacterium]MCH4278156.1 50S ribosomal protein L29 [Bacilli bacterium]MCI2054560.1 50S ribosomal protein L29 [Bacilli bacterium]
MDIKEFRALSPKELDEKLAELRQKQFELSRQKAVGQLEHPDDVRGIRKDIAKAETVKHERELQIAVPEKK